MSHLGRNVSHMDHQPTPEAESRALAAVVKRHLDAAGISLRSASESTGIPKATLSRRLGGQTPLVYTELVMLATVLGATVKDLADEAASDLRAAA